jgi:hypothetical protein
MLGTLPDEASAKVTIVLATSFAGTLDEVVTVEAQQLDPATESNRAELKTEVRTAPAAGGGSSPGNGPGGGAPGGASPSSGGGAAADKTVAVSLGAVSITAAHPKRLLRLRLTAREPVRLTLALVLRGKTVLAAKRSVRPGRHTLTFALPRRVASGRGTLRLTLADSLRNTKRTTRKLRIPKRPAR